MKKLLSLFLALAMLMSLSITTVVADNSHDVNVSYQPEITGLTVVGNSSTNDDGALVFTDDDQMTVTVSGRNLDIATVNNAVSWGESYSLDLKTYADYYWTISEDGSTATFTFSYSLMKEYFPVNYQMYYTNDGTTLIATGIYIYCEEGGTAEITGMEITAGATKDATSGVYVISYGSTTDVTVKVTGTNLKCADSNHLIQLPSGNEAMTIANGWTFANDGCSAEKDFDVSEFAGCLTVFVVQYSNDGTTFTEGLKIMYEAVIVSVDITWGAMSFSYDSVNAWTANGNTVTVSTNDDNAADYVDVSVAFAFNADAADLGISYTLDVTETTLDDAKTSCDFTLNLSGKPSKAFDGTVGTVTLTIEQAEYAYQSEN